jgi:hypothetical protein
MENKFKQEDCYIPITSKSINRTKILEYALTQNYTQSGYDEVAGFQQTILSESFIKGDKFLNMLHTELNIPIDHFRIKKMEPNSFYTFHIDIGRAASINLMLSEGVDNITYFKIGEQHKQLLDILPLKYELDTYYLVNARIPHAALSDKDPRYLLSITIKIDEVIEADPTVSFSKYRALMSPNF